jgi:Zn-dependent M32 family carboxypeptidase
MGIHPAVAQKMGAEALRSKAISVVDQLDAAQEQGAPPQELAKVFNSLDPNLKQAVQAVKLEKEKLKQQELDGINQVADLQQNQMLVPGSAVDRVNSPITKQIVPGILQETMSIGKQ